MSFSKIMLQVAAVMAVALFVLPGYVSAAENVEKTITIDARSAHESEYDEVVNVANESAKQNKATWNPVPQGIWIGSSVEESLFQMNQVVPQNSLFELTWEAKFPTSRVGSGVADYVLRLPTYFPTGEEWNIIFTAARMKAVPVYSWNDGIHFGGIGSYTVGYGAAGSSLDTSVYDGNDMWTVDGRTYIHCRGALIPGELYVFKVSATYQGLQETRFSFYISPNDVVGDELYNANVGYSLYIGGAYRPGVLQNLSLDLGASYDMRESLGNGVFLKYYDVGPGSTIRMLTQSIGTPGTKGHHIAMVPFKTESGAANLSVQVWNYGMTSKFIDVGGWNYKDYVLVGSPGNITQSAGDYPYYNIILTANEAMTIGFVFEDTQNANVRESFINGLQIFYHIQSSYGVSATPLASKLNFFSSTGSLLNEAKAFEREDIWAPVVGAFTSIAVNFLIGAVPGLPLISLLYQTIPEVKFAVDWVIGNFNNLIDGAWNVLVDIGEFIWSVGEAIFNTLTWLVDAILEYGSVILGLLIVGVAIALFLMPIKYQWTLWQGALEAAKGNLSGAQKKFSEVSSDIQDKAGKIKGLV